MESLLTVFACARAMKMQKSPEHALDLSVGSIDIVGEDISCAFFRSTVVIGNLILRCKTSGAFSKAEAPHSLVRSKEMRKPACIYYRRLGPGALSR